MPRRWVTGLVAPHAQRAHTPAVNGAVGRSLVDDLSDRAMVMATRIADSVSGKDLDDTLQSLTRAAVEMLPGVDEATISIRHESGSLRSYGLTADFLEDLDSWQYDHAEGPCYDGVTDNAFTVCGDLRSDPRYPSYGPRAVAAGIRSQAGLRIFESMRTVGGLNIYSRSPEPSRTSRSWWSSSRSTRAPRSPTPPRSTGSATRSRPAR